MVCPLDWHAPIADIIAEAPLRHAGGGGFATIAHLLRRSTIMISAKETMKNPPFGVARIG